VRILIPETTTTTVNATLNLSLTARRPAGGPAARLAALQRQLLAAATAGITDRETRACLRRAAQDAGALAWLSGFPLLTFPELFEEQKRIALSRLQRQRDIRARSQITLWAAARAGMSALLRRRPDMIAGRGAGARRQSWNLLLRRDCCPAV
jgi:hypothetical protein